MGVQGRNSQCQKRKFRAKLYILCVKLKLRLHLGSSEKSLKSLKYGGPAFTMVVTGDDDDFAKKKSRK